MNQNLPALVFAAACIAQALSPAAAQDVYRCGDSYGQKPCPGGALVPTDDSRTDAQRAAAREAAQRTSKAADAMEKTRLKEEAKPVQGYLPAPPIETATEENKAGAFVKPRKPQFFTAGAPRKPGEGPPKKKKSKAKKKDAPAKKSDA